MAEAKAEKSKRDILRGRVVDLVVEFINSEGDIRQIDLERLFGPPHQHSVSYVLCMIPFSYSGSKTTARFKSKREILQDLHDRVVDLVIEFKNSEGSSMSQWDLLSLFYSGSVAGVLCGIPIKYSQVS